MKNIGMAVMIAGLWVLAFLLTVREQRRRREIYANGCIEAHMNIRSAYFIIAMGIAIYLYFTMDLFWPFLKNTTGITYLVSIAPCMLCLVLACWVLLRRITLDPKRGSLTVSGLFGKHVYLVSNITEVRCKWFELGAFSGKKCMFYLFNTKLYENEDLLDLCIRKMSGCKVNLPLECADVIAFNPNQPLSVAHGEKPSLFFREDGLLSSGILLCPPYRYLLRRTALSKIRISDDRVFMHFGHGVFFADENGNVTGQTAPCNIELTFQGMPSMTVYITRKICSKQLPSDRFVGLLEKGEYFVLDSLFPPLCDTWMLTGQLEKDSEKRTITLYFSDVQEISVKVVNQL